MAKKSVTGFWVSLLTLVGSVVGITVLLEKGAFSLPTRVALALIPPIAWVFCIVYMLRILRSLDEMQKRIHLEALAIAYPSVFVVIFLCEYLRKAGVLSHLMPDHVLMIMMVLLGISYFIAWRRYQ